MTELAAGRGANAGLRIVCPNGHLGFAPLKTASFRRGLDVAPDLICADSGSNDIGPVPLGSDGTASPLAWQTHDLEEMLLGARRLGIPMIIGSAGDTGANSRVDLFVGIVRELARKHGLGPFKLGYFYSEVDKERIRRAITSGDAVHGLDGRPDLTLPSSSPSQSAATWSCRRRAPPSGAPPIASPAPAPGSRSSTSMCLRLRLPRANRRSRSTNHPRRPSRLRCPPHRLLLLLRRRPSRSRLPAAAAAILPPA